MSETTDKWVIALIVAVGLAGVGVIAWINFRQPPDIPTPEMAAPEPAPAEQEPAEPRYPVPPPDEPETTEPEPDPLPPLDESDTDFSRALTDLFDGTLEPLLTDEAVIEKLVATIDNLPRDRVAERLRPVDKPPGSFVAEPAPGNEKYTLGAENFARYDALVDMLATAEIDDIVATYQRYYPLLQEAYVSLGYPDGYFNDRVIEVIDHLLATPETGGELQLVRPNVLYEFADPELEALSSGQKLLLRIGPGNAERTKSVLEQIRQRLAN